MTKESEKKESFAEARYASSLSLTDMAKAVRYAALLPRIRRFDFFLFIGPHGIGKSSIAEAAGRITLAEIGFKDSWYVPIACASMTPGSLMIPFPRPLGNKKKGRDVIPHFENLITEELVTLRDGDHLSLEEVMLAPPESMHEWRNITAPVNGHRRLGMFELPIDILVTGDGNMPGAGASLSPFLDDPADRSRACELPVLCSFPETEGEPCIPPERMHVSSSVDEFISQAVRVGVHPSTIGFAKRYSDLFNRSASRFWCDQNLSFRSLVQADAYLDILQYEPMDFVRKILVGKIGAEAAYRFVQHIEEARIPEPSLIWNKQEPLPVEPGWSYQAAYSVLAYSKSLYTSQVAKNKAVVKHLFDVTFDWPPEILASVWPALNGSPFSELIMWFINSGFIEAAKWRNRHNYARIEARNAWAKPTDGS